MLSEPAPPVEMTIDKETVTRPADRSGAFDPSVKKVIQVDAKEPEPNGALAAETEEVLNPAQDLSQSKEVANKGEQTRVVEDIVPTPERDQFSNTAFGDFEAENSKGGPELGDKRKTADSSNRNNTAREGEVNTIDDKSPKVDHVAAPASKKHKTTSTRHSTTGRKASRGKKWMAPVGRTQRRTRSQGLHES